ncbi:inner membrane protein YedI [Rhizobium sp. CIAT894]|nr:inner membrane protein YedI [Rhizobium sp. CIAT894]
MSVGLIALLDDIAALAKVAAASLDDIAGQAAKAGAKAAGVVIDDAAVTPRYVTGFSASRELPIIGKIALGSLKNKLLILLPAALILSLVAPQAITPLLMIGGLFLCYEGVEKVYGLVLPHAAHVHESALETASLDARSLEDQKVAGAIKTDFILSAEIMAITLGALPSGNIFTQAFILAVVGLGITVMVYGGVGLIVKADDLGLMMARSQTAPPIGPFFRAVGRGLVTGMPYFLKVLGVVGTAAMIWVGGGIIVHGLEAYGAGGLAHLIHDAGEAVTHAIPVLTSVLRWIVEAAGAGIVGIVVGLITIPVVGYVISPIWGVPQIAPAAPPAERGAGGWEEMKAPSGEAFGLTSDRRLECRSVPAHFRRTYSPTRPVASCEVGQTARRAQLPHR